LHLINQHTKPHPAYNDIVPTSYAHLLPLYQHPSAADSYHRATTKAELDAILAKPSVQKPENLQLVEMVVDKLDTSWRLASTLAGRGKETQDYLTNEGFTDTYGGWALGEDSGSRGGGVVWK
jgi:pyruvate decarboxylase